MQRCTVVTRGYLTTSLIDFKDHVFEIKKEIRNKSPLLYSAFILWIFFTKGEPYVCISGAKQVVTQTPTCFVQRCTHMARGNRNAPKQLPKAASLCFMNSVLYFAIHKGVVTTTSRGSKGTKYPRKIGKMRPTVPALLRILPQIVIVKDVEMSLRTHTGTRQRT